MAPGQLSVTPVTRLISGAGTADGPHTVIGPGQVNVGGVLSILVL
jgi:hypothetical protein